MKKNFGTQIWAKEVSLVFFEIVYNNSLQQCLSQNRPKPGPKLVFLQFSQVWSIIFPLNCIG